MSKRHATPGERSTSVVSPLAVFGLGTTAISAGVLAQPIQFDDPNPYTDEGWVVRLATADFDRDAQMDIAVQASTGIQILFNDGAGGLIAGEPIALPIQVYDLAAADMDDDLDADVLWMERQANQDYVLNIWYNDGDGRSGQLQQVVLQERPWIPMIPTDFDGDGRTDVIFGRAGRTISVLLNRGVGSFEQRDLFTMGGTSYGLEAMAAGDFDLDGDVDIAATYQYVYSYRYTYIKGTQVMLLLNEGGESLRQSGATGLPWQDDNIRAVSMATGDLDGDGDIDVVITGQTLDDGPPNQTAFVRNDPVARPVLVTQYPSSARRRSAITLEDLNTDGRLDVVFVDDGVRGVNIIRNDGDFVFTGLSPFYSGIDGPALGVADLSSDGQFDLLHAGMNGLAVLANATPFRGPQLGASRLVRGQQAILVVSGAVPGETVDFVYGLSGAGHSRGILSLGGLTLDIAEPVVHLGRAQAQANGRAVLRRTIPSDTPSGPVTIQAMIGRGPGGRDSVKTLFSTALIE